MNKAKELSVKQYFDKYVNKDEIRESVILRFAESFDEYKFRSRVNAISDEEMELVKYRPFTDNEQKSVHNSAYQLGWNDFKNKLLKK